MLQSSNKMATRITSCYLKRNLLCNNNGLPHFIKIATSLNGNKNHLSNIVIRPYSTRLIEVGPMETPKSDGQYEPGQLFLHRIFGYRGVVLFPWLAKVHDSQQSKSSQFVHNSDGVNTQKRNFKPLSEFVSSEIPSDGVTFDTAYKPPENHVPNLTVHPYYQVLMHTDDCKYVSRRIQTDNVTFLYHHHSLAPIPCSDYVAHEDILPYTSHEETPVKHELFQQFFEYKSCPNGEHKYESKEYLNVWKNKFPWLNLSDVYKETTENIRVTVIPFYLGCQEILENGRPSRHKNWWRYCVRLENLCDQDVHLLERCWRIRSHLAEGANSIEKVEGRGVVGVEPILSKNESAFQYSSHVHLEASSGYMWGTYKMQRCEDRHIFECKIPTFSLESRLSPSD